MKNIFKINITTYLLLLSILLCGYFNYLLIISLILIIHDLGHIVFLKLFKIKINNITILPFGSIINSDLKLNTESYFKYGSDFMHALNNKLRQETEN